jgi:nucleotide-binding universal stress UspA family protein
VRTPRRTTVAVRRIVVAADASQPGRIALESAIRLAQRLQAELEGLFVEDSDLKRLSELPVAREIRFGAGGFGRPASSVAEDLRNESMRLRHRFEEQASRARIKATFRVAEGRIEHSIVQLGGEADLLVVGLARRRAWSLFGVSEGQAEFANRPLVLYDGTDGAERALDLAARLAADDEAALAVVVRAGNEADALRLRRRAAQRLAEHGQGARFRQAAAPTLAALSQAVAALGASVLVISSEDALLEGEGFRRLTDEMTCPVVVVR